MNLGDSTPRAGAGAGLVRQGRQGRGFQRGCLAIKRRLNGARCALARISHHHPAATADPLGLAGRLCVAQSCYAQSPVRPSVTARSAGLSSTGRQAHPPRPSSRLDVVCTPSPSFSPCGPPNRRLGGLATGSGEKSGLAVHERCGVVPASKTQPSSKRSSSTWRRPGHARSPPAARAPPQASHPSPTDYAFLLTLSARSRVVHDPGRHPSCRRQTNPENTPNIALSLTVPTLDPLTDIADLWRRPCPDGPQFSGVD